MHANLDKDRQIIAWNRAGRRTNYHQTSLFGIIGGGVGGVVVAGNTITEAVVLHTDRPIRIILISIPVKWP